MNEFESAGGVAQSVRRFVFGTRHSSADADSSAAPPPDGSTLSVSVCELLERSYGLYTWPSAPVLAQYLWSQYSGAEKGRQHQLLRGTNVLELGAGTALPSLLAARLGASVTVTDSSHQVLANLQRSLQLNRPTGDSPVDIGAAGGDWTPLGSGLVRPLRLVWGHASPQLVQLPPQQLLLGADVLYDERLHEQLWWTVAFLFDMAVRGGVRPRFVFTYQERGAGGGGASLAPLLRHWRLAARRLSLAQFGADGPALAGSQMPGNHSVLLYEVTPM